MTHAEFEKWCEDNEIKEKTNEYANGIDYTFVTLKDNWIGVFERDCYCGIYPVIQACDREKALSFISLREPVTVPMQELIPE